MKLQLLLALRHSASDTAAPAGVESAAAPATWLLRVPWALGNPVQGPEEPWELLQHPCRC
jgi:hypothetical protein